MSRLYVYQVIGKLVRRYGTRDPFELMDAMHVQVRFYYDLTRTKGFTRYFLRQYFAGINGNLPASEQRVVAAHELGHIVLHAEALKTAPLFDTAVLLADEDVLECVQRPDADFGALCLSMDVSPGLMNFKLRSMQKRGIDVPLVSECDSRFLYRDAVPPL